MTFIVALCVKARTSLIHHATSTYSSSYVTGELLLSLPRGEGMACAFCCFRDLELTSSSLLMGDALAKRLYNVALLLEASVANVKEHDSSRSESTLTSGVCRDVLTHVSMQRYALHVDSNEQ